MLTQSLSLNHRHILSLSHTNFLSYTQAPSLSNHISNPLSLSLLPDLELLLPDGVLLVVPTPGPGAPRPTHVGPGVLTLDLVKLQSCQILKNDIYAMF